MTTAQRIELLVPILAGFPELGTPDAATLTAWVADDLGRADALDAWAAREGDGVLCRAVAPQRLQHILAGNLAVSGIQSLVCGLMLGGANCVKLASGADDEPATRRIHAFLDALPEPLRRLVTLRDEASVDPEADVVVAYGGDATIREVRTQLDACQRLVVYGPKASLLWLGRVGSLCAELAARAAHDVAQYAQAGCLSPQAIYLEAGSDVDAFLDELAAGMARETDGLDEEPLPLGQTGAITEARDLAAALGDDLRVPADGGLAWTIIRRQKPGWEFSPGRRTIFVRVVAGLSALIAELEPLRGRLSTVGLAGRLDNATECAFGGLGVARFCPAGRMQQPPPAWHHDGRPQLADLVTWRDDETAL